MTPISVWLPIRVQCILVVAAFLAAIIGAAIGIAAFLDWVVSLAF